MKLIIYTILIILAILMFSRLTGYSERMKAINKYNCAVYGYYEDCKTPLLPEDKLK